MLRWSLELGRIFGIRLSVHFTFGLLVAYVAYSGWEMSGGNPWAALGSVALLGAFFVCVVLHELGHALTARAYGIRVPRIRILPIGGMAEFESIPRQPRQEILISLAGPAVNFVLAALLWPFVTFPEHWDSPEALFTFPGMVRQVLLANLVMGVFNLVPVFPMDGGRILRAVLAMRLRYQRATFWAATVGKVLAVVAIVLALYTGMAMAAVLFAFIFLVGELEYRAVLFRERTEALRREAWARAYNLPPSGPPMLN